MRKVIDTSTQKENDRVNVQKSFSASRSRVVSLKLVRIEGKGKNRVAILEIMGKEQQLPLGDMLDLTYTLEVKLDE